ncbi:MAG: histidine phosphatase family protein, partial [Gammaproteobacteria bacterium]
MIYLLRHAETEWNYEMRKQGLDDSPLTVTGRSQAVAYGKV